MKKTVMFVLLTVLMVSIIAMGQTKIVKRRAGAAAGQTATQQLTLTVNSALTITTTSLPSAVVGQAYSATLTVSGGTAPYMWSLTSGSTLPAGLALSSSGVISGTPTSAVTNSSFSVTVTDSSH